MNRTEYDEYTAAFATGTEGMSHLSSGACPGCHDCGLEEHPDMDCGEYDLAGKPSFSWQPCDICNRSLGGDRHPSHYVDENDTVVHLSVCTDCVLFINYGRLDDSTMLEIEESTP